MRHCIGVIIAFSIGISSICYSTEDSSTLPEGIEPDIVETVDVKVATDAEVLIIKDGNPWNYPSNEVALSTLGKTYDVMNTGSLASTDLSVYQIIIIASDQSTSTYNNLIANKSKLADYVSNGGVLLAHACDNGWRIGHWSSSFLPGGVGHVKTSQQYLSIVDSTSQIIDGISDAALDNWNYSTHGYFTNLVAGTNIIIGITGNPTGQPTYVEYSWGNGSVLATMQTIEWPWRGSQGTEELLLNEINYAQTLLCPEPTTYESWSFVQISDTHIGSSNEARTNLVVVLNKVIKEVGPKFIVNTGDIVDFGCAWFGNDFCRTDFYESYSQAIALATDAGIHIYNIPGNHDQRLGPAVLRPCGNFPSCFQDPLGNTNNEFYLGRSTFLYDNIVLFAVLDTGNGNCSGTLNDEDIDFLQGLDQCIPKFILTHHPAVADPDDGGFLSDRFCDNVSIVEGQEDFISYCENPKNHVYMVLSGHTHNNRVCDSNLGNPTAYPYYVQTGSAADESFSIVSFESPPALNTVYLNTDDYNYISAQLYSPGELHTYDSDGHHTGCEPGGSSERGILHSVYFSSYVFETEEGSEVSPEEVMICDPFDQYLYQVVGTEACAYKLKITSVNAGQQISFNVIDVPTSPCARHAYAVNWDILAEGGEGVVLSIDADGDGIYERTVIADEDLTSEEFALQTETIIDFEPDVVNLRSPGQVVTVYIELPGGFDVSDIDVSTLMINDTVSALPKPFKIDDYDEDGMPDFMVKFNRKQVTEILDSGIQMVTLRGRLTDGRPLAGIDFIRVIDGMETEAIEPESELDVSEVFSTDLEEGQLPIIDDSFDTGEEDVKEAVGFLLYEAGDIINQLGSESFNNEESAFALSCSIDDVFTMLDEGMYLESLIFIENDILQRTDGSANIGQPDQDDWITSIEGQTLLYPLLAETIELLESML